MTQPRPILNWTRVCYSVDFADETPVILRAERVRGHLNFTPAVPAASTFLDDMARGVPIVSCLTAAESFSRWIEAPFPSQRKAARVFPTLLDIQLPFPLEDCVYTFLGPRATAQRTTRVLAVAARNVDAKRRIASLSEQNLDAAVLDYEGLALWTQSLHESPPGAKEEDTARAVIYCGARRSTLVLGMGRRFICAHSVNPADPGHINRLLHAEFDSTAEATESEADPGSEAGPQKDTVSRKPIVTWFLTGPQAGGSDLAGHVRKELLRAWPGPLSTHDQPDTFLARALATRALLPGPLSCNLRTGPLTHSLISQHSTRRHATALGVFLLAGALLYGGSLAIDARTRSRSRALDKTFSEFCVRLGGSRTAKGDDAIADARAQLEANRELLAPFVSAFDPSLLATIETIRKAGLAHGLQFDEVKIHSSGIMIRGTSPTWEACAPLQAALATAGYHADLDRRDALANERIPFTIKLEASQ